MILSCKHKQAMSQYIPSTTNVPTKNGAYNIYVYVYIYIYVYVYMYIYISYTKNGTSSMTTYFVICLNLHVPVPSTTSTSSTWLRFSLPVARWAWKTMGKVPEFHSLCCPMFRESRKTGEGHWGTALQPLIRKAKIHTLGFWVSFQALEWSISVIWNYADSIVDLGRIRISDKQLELRDTPIMEKIQSSFLGIIVCKKKIHCKVRSIRVTSSISIIV
jgi:hypothetical protein